LIRLFPLILIIQIISQSINFKYSIHQRRRCRWNIQLLINLLQMISRLIATNLFGQISNFPYLIAIELLGWLIIPLKLLLLLLHLPPHPIHLTNRLLQLPSLDAPHQRIVLHVLRVIIMRTMIQLRFHHLTTDVLQSTTSKGGSFYQRIRCPRAPLTLRSQPPRPYKRMQRRSRQIRLSLGPLANRLEADPLLPRII
jgi:hypothetical protein